VANVTDLRTRLEDRAAEGDPDAARILTAVQRREASERDWADMRLTRLRPIVLGKPMEIEPAPPPPATTTEALEHAVAVAVGGDSHRPDRRCRLCVRADELDMWQPLLGLTLAELA
jgi:hypothetical protein